MLIGEKDPTLITNFLENADISRWNTNTFDISLTKNAIAFIMLNDGIPIIYQGQEQNFTGKFDPQNRAAVWFSKYNTDSELYKHIAAINKLRRQAIANSAQYTISPTSVIFADASTMAMQKGPDNNNNVLTVLNKAGQDAADHTFTIPESRFQPGQVLVDIIGCNSVTVGDKGSIKSTIKYGHPQVFYPSAGLKGTGICSADKDIAPSASSTPGSPSGKTTSAAGRTTIGASLAGLLAVSAVAMAL